MTPEQQLREKIMQAKSIHDSPEALARAQAFASSAQREVGAAGSPAQPLWKAVGRHLSVFVGLVALTLTLLYWPAIGGELGYWWRHRTDTRQAPSSVEEYNLLTAEGEAGFQVDVPIVPEKRIIPTDNRIVIDKIEVNAPIVDMDGGDDNSVLTALQNGVGHYPDTAFPGQGGNAFLTAHSSYWWWDKGNYKFIFQHLEKLVVGDILTVYYNQRRYDYRVREIKTVKPVGDHVDALFAQEPYINDPILTLMTCTPVGTTLNRLIVVAEQISPAPGTNSVAGAGEELLPVI